VNLIKKAKLADGLQISRQAISDAVRRGALAQVEGRIDLDAPDTKAYIAAVERRKDITFNPVARPQARSRYKKRTTLARGKPVGTELTEISSSGTRMGDMTLDVEPDAVVLSRAQLERLKVAESVIKMRVETKAKRQELVSREITAGVFAELASVDTSEFHPLADKISVDVAAKCGVEDEEVILEVKKIINKHVFRALKHRQRLMDDYLQKIGKN
jgi:hypothetical protein